MIQEYICKLCSKKFKNNGFGKHIIGIHHISINNYYNQFIRKNEDEGKCEVCKKPTTFYSLPAGYHKCCSRKCSEIRTRKAREKTCFKNFNGPSPYSSDLVRQKGINTSILRFGSKHALQNKTIIKRREDKYFKLHGVKNPFQNSEVQEKRRITCNKNLGTDWPMQNLDVFLKREKGYFKRKEFIFPSGNIIIVQGEEPQFLKHIITQNIIQENEIQKGLKFQYLTSDGKIKNYFSDFLIKHLNLIVEIKSSYILSKYEKYMKEKEDCVKRNGYNFILIIDQKYEEFDKLIQKLQETN